MQRGKARRPKSKDTCPPWQCNTICAIATAVVDGRVVTKSFQRKSGPDARNGGRSSHAGAVRMGPSALYRRTGTVRSSVRSPHIVGSQRSAPRRHPCRPAARFCSEMTVSAVSAGRPPSLQVAAQRIWGSLDRIDLCSQAAAALALSVGAMHWYRAHTVSLLRSKTSSRRWGRAAVRANVRAYCLRGWASRTTRFLGLSWPTAFTAKSLSLALKPCDRLDLFDSNPCVLPRTVIGELMLT